jgi:hypothetical protein
MYTASDGTPALLSATGLCAIGVGLGDSAPGPVSAALTTTLREHVLPSDWRDHVTLLPGEERLFRLRAVVPEDRTGHWEIEGPDGSPTTLAFRWRAVP